MEKQMVQGQIENKALKESLNIRDVQIKEKDTRIKELKAKVDSMDDVQAMIE